MKQSLVKFPNGLKVMLCSKQSSIVSISFSLCFGAEQEKMSESGVTHFIESLYKNSLTKLISKFGGVVETATDYEHFEVTITTVREKLEYCLNTLTDIIFDFHPKFESFEREKMRILQEVENAKNNPISILKELTQKVRYKGTSLSTSIVGTTKSISSLTLERMRDYYKSICCPKYMLLSIVGNISDEILKQPLNDQKMVDGQTQTTNKVQKNVADIGSEKTSVSMAVDKKYNQDSLEYIKNLVVKTYYSKSINLTRKAKHNSTKYCQMSNFVSLVKQKNLNQSRLQISLPSASYSTSGYRYSKLIVNYMRGFLIANLTGEEGLYSFDIETKQFKNNAHVLITVAVDYEKTEEVYNKIILLLKRLKEQSISQKEFESLKVAEKTLISLKSERILDIAKRFNKWLYLTGEQFNLLRELKRIDALDFDNFNDVLKSVLNFKQMAVVYLGKKVDIDFKGVV